MTDKEIILAACEKAIKQGYTPPMDMQVQMGMQGYRWDLGKYIEWYPRVIFSHDFAKAFWGEHLLYRFNGVVYEPTKGTDKNDGSHIVCWCYHLQQIVLQENPIKYLEQFLEAKRA